MGNVIFSVFRNENFIDLDMYQSGKEECDPGHIFGPAARNHYLFHYVIQGKGKLMAHDSNGITQTHEIHAGQGFLLFPDQISTYIANMEDPWTYMWIEFDGLRVKEALERTTMSKDQPVYKTHTPSLRNDMVREMDYIVMNSKDASSFNIIGHLYLFFSNLVESTRLISNKKTSRLADFYVKEAIAFIEQNFDKQISVEMIAESLGIERSYFGKLFKRIMGKSPQQFLINYRLVKAAELLKATDRSIQDIAGSVGYENQLHFSRAFKSAYGKSPRQWRTSNSMH